MKLSAPIHVLKRKARREARAADIPLHAALDAVAQREGFGRWSLLAAKASEETPASRLYRSLRPGEMLLVGARPGQGKTLMSLALAIEAMRAGHGSAFFSLEYTEMDIRSRFDVLDVAWSEFSDRFVFDDADAIKAPYIASRLQSARPGTFVVIDYLQILDQRRENPDLASQVRDLKALAVARGLTIAFVSQIDRSYDPQAKPFPDPGDVRLPNPVDLALFDRMCFLNNGAVQFAAA